MLVGALSGTGMAAVAGEERGGGAGQFLTENLMEEEIPKTGI